MKENRLHTYERLREKAWDSPWGRRILSELGFLLEVSLTQDGALDDQLLPAIDALFARWQAEGAITRQAVLETEEALKALAPRARQYEVICAAHAHIDMNWMWGFNETASVTVDTFRTMLRLMEEYPQFTFSQSQASVYHIIETYAPEMLGEIRRRVHEGRWEVTASTWVENDKNMSGSEAMVRHLLYTRRYLASLLDIAEDTVRIDFEPDTFGHTGNLPELLTDGGVKYYYHCRGTEGPHIFRWQAPSGAQVLAYREPAWYNQTIDGDLFLNVPGFCHRYGIKTYLKVYGVGDHGGGPTRRDVDRLIEMSAWPLFPTIRFGTIHSFFEKLEAVREQFPIVRDEHNYIFTGCYTSQARIKQANRIGEDKLCAAEITDALATALCPGYRTASPFEPAWRRVLFNQFHDILPGSGVRETREYALSEFQKALTVANINANHAMETIAASIDTSFAAAGSGESVATGASHGESVSAGAGVGESVSAGAGVGFGTSEAEGYHFPMAERGSGTVRVYAVFNQTQRERYTTAELTVWDWPGDPARITAQDADGHPIPVQLLKTGTHYWGHHYLRLAAPVRVPAAGYTCITLREGEPLHVTMLPYNDPRKDTLTDEPIILENEKLRAAFLPGTMQLISLRSKITGEELVDPTRPAGSFRLITEETSQGMSAWRVGRFARVKNLSETCPVRVSKITHGPVRQSIEFDFPFAGSSLQAAVTLDNTEGTLRYDVSVDWRETGGDAGVPQLQFDLPLREATPFSRCTVPLDVRDRPALRQDVPCTGLIARAKDGATVALVTDCKYGLRNEGQGFAADLIRASYDPDVLPDIGMHSFAVGIALTDGDPESLLTCAEDFVRVLSTCAVPAHPGSLPLSASLVRVEGAHLIGIKRAEDGDGLILRVLRPQETDGEAVFSFCKSVTSAEAVSVMEHPNGSACSVQGSEVRLPLGPHAIGSVRVRL